MIDPSEVSAVFVTKGDHDLSEIGEAVIESGIKDVVVWNNATRTRDLSCYGRYAAIAEAKHEWIYHQDDDLVTPIADLLACVDPERDRWVIVANNRIDEEWPLTAMGVVFHRDLADCFGPYIDSYGEDADFYRVSDVIFGYANAYRRVWVGYRDLPWQTAPDRMHLQHDHYEVRMRARARILDLMSKQKVAA